MSAVPQSPIRARSALELPRNTILLGDALDRLRELPNDSVDCVITSPPYFLLRDYGIDGQLGLEASVEEFVQRLVTVLDSLARVLRPTGSLWLNIGDSYSRANRYGAPPKSLLLAPERVLLALAAGGWIVRNKIVWAKPNPMPSSVRDRLNCGWEYVFHIVRSRSYFYDMDAIREPHLSSARRLTARRSRAKAKTGPATYRPSKPAWAGPLAGRNDGLVRARAEGRAGHSLGKNPGDVWSLPTGGYRGAHFAVFPERLLERPIRASCPARVCSVCAEPWIQAQGVATTTSCTCDAGAVRGLVLDPFIGSGTTAVVAQRLGRDWLGIELKPEFRNLALARISSVRRCGRARTRGGDA